LLAEAKAYQQQVILQAKGATAEYLALLPEYRKAPKVMRERMYLDTLQTIFSHTPKIVLDTPGSNSMMYLPLDQLLRAANAALPAATTVPLAFPKAENPVPANETPTESNTTTRPTAASFEGRPDYTLSTSTTGGNT
jgi:membrane protease subunit HflK